MSLIYINPYSFGVALDPDAAAYITAVEGPSGDNQALEPAIVTAINDFVVGCKADGIWSAIKASCILAGARTRLGALTPLVGTAPTSVNFVDGDYDRKTGLVGDGSTKYLDTNRNNNADPQNSKHISTYISTVSTSGGFGASNRYPCYLANDYSTGGTILQRNENNATTMATSNNSAQSSQSTGNPGTKTGFAGINRSASSSYTFRIDSTSYTVNTTSATPRSSNIRVMNQTHVPASTYSNGRQAFYSIGESLDIVLLDTRVTALINAIATAI